MDGPPWNTLVSEPTGAARPGNVERSTAAMSGQSTPYDAAYKRLFSHREMVRHLLTGFVPGELAGELDLSTLERWPDSQVSDDLRQRHQDRVWRVRRREQWLYVLVLLEFQSSVDRSMAVRILVYTGLLYQDLLLDGARDPLPPVLPFVLYHGRGRWTAPEEVADLCAPAGERLAPYQPSQRYFLLATRSYTESPLPPGRNLVSALIRLQTSRRADELATAVVALDEWLSEPQSEGLRRAFTEWIRRVLLPARSSGGGVPVLEDLREVRGMIPGQEQTWVEMAREDAEAEGLARGLAEGRAEGRAQGQVELILRMAAHKFDSIAADRLTEWLGRLDDPERMTEAGMWLLDSESSEELLARLEHGPAGASNAGDSPSA